MAAQPSPGQRQNPRPGDFFDLESEQMSSTERRQHPRIQLDLPLQLTFGEKTFDTRISDISTSGIRFRTPEALPLMTRVQIGLELPSGEESGPVALNGVVVRSDVRPDAAPLHGRSVSILPRGEGARGRDERDDRNEIDRHGFPCGCLGAPYLG